MLLPRTTHIVLLLISLRLMLTTFGHCHGAYSQQDYLSGFLQAFTGAVEIEEFPWNDAVVVVDNESPSQDFGLQPEQDVVKYGSGIVIMQTSWVSN